MTTIEATPAAPPARLPSRAALLTSRRRTAEEQADVAVTREQRHLASWDLAAIFLVLGYEWLLSGLNKLASPDFRAGLGDRLQQAAKDNPNHWYVWFLNQVAIPHTTAAATLVEGGELLIGLGIALGAALWIGGDRLPVG